uniref:Selenoprotein M n=1 Tax=Xiphophorus couchianus TaxID=32473 RepID=A0A3B5MUZ5_9TELE
MRQSVKAFVMQDIPLYHNLVMKHIPGADPELVLLNHYYEELDRIALSDMTRSEINELLEKLGFYKKAQPEDEVPEELRFAPAKDSPFKDDRPLKSSMSTVDTENASSESNPEVKHTDL